MDAGNTRARRGWPAQLAAVLQHPGLWLEAVRASWALTRRGWWRHRPFLPVPDRGYLAWRVATAYGADDVPIRADDVVDYLRWRARQRHR